MEISGLPKREMTALRSQVIKIHLTQYLQTIYLKSHESEYTIQPTRIISYYVTTFFLYTLSKCMLLHKAVFYKNFSLRT